MNLQQLKVFLEVCNGKTLLEAADKLGLKQPTVSFHLSKLEEKLGIELFHKFSRSLQPTEAAADLLPYARRIVGLMEEAKERMDERREQGTGKLRLGASYTPATYFMPPYFAEFQKLYPNIQLLLSVKKAEAVLGMLRRYEIDAAVVSLPDSQEEGLVIEPLIEDELKLLISPDHSLAKQKTVRIEDLRHETFLLHEPGSTSRKLTDEWAEQVGLRYGSIMELGAIETIKEALKYNLGVGVLPLRSVIRETAAGVFLQLDLPDYLNRRHICLVYRDEDVLLPHVRFFLQFLKSRILPAGV